MDELTKIIEIIIWPVTIIVVVMVLRSPLAILVPTLKKLRYKDLELEFEREANKILSEAERDLPEIEEIRTPVQEDSGIRFSRSRPDAVTEILSEWRALELELRKLAGSRNVQSGRTIRSLISGLETAGLISNEAANVVLELSALRNKVAHSNAKVITYEASTAFVNATRRVIASFKVLNS